MLISEEDLNSQTKLLDIKNKTHTHTHTEKEEIHSTISTYCTVYTRTRVQVC